MGRFFAIGRAARTAAHSIWSVRYAGIASTGRINLFEPLEQRTLLSTYTVNSLVDDGSGGTGGVVTLRWAIQQANAGSGAQTINLDSSLTADGPATIELNGTALEISGHVKIEGPEDDSLTIDGQGNSRVFTIDSGSVTEIDHLIITGGSASTGGGIDNMGTFALVDSIVTGNSASGIGGGIDNQGTAAITDSVISDNSTDADGGGVYNSGTMTVDDSTISDNLALNASGNLSPEGIYYGNGGGVRSSGELTITDSTISGNQSRWGGGIYNSSSAYLTVNTSTISGNTSGAGGGIYLISSTASVTDSTISGNSDNSDGGGIFDWASYLTVTDSTIVGNSGGILDTSSNPCTIQGSIIADNGASNLWGSNFSGSDNFIGPPVTCSTTVNEGSDYTLSVSSSTADGVSWPVDHWTVDWNDGTDGGSDPENISGESGSTSAHSFASGTSWADVTIMAVDTQGNTFSLPDAFIDVIPAAPTSLAGDVISSTEVDLSWTGVTSAISSGYLIYASTDGTNFDPIGGAPFGTTSYNATDLTPGTSYSFRVTTDGAAAESTASNIITAQTTFVPPSLDVTASAAAIENQAYELDLSAYFADGEPDAIDHWIVDWGDGTTPHFYAQPLDNSVVVATHTFAAAFASGTVSITAVDENGAEFDATAQSVTLAPATPTGLAASAASANEIDLTWTDHSSIESGYLIFCSTDNENFFQIDEIAANETSYQATGLNPGTQYWFKVAADGTDASSSLSSSAAASTTAASPVLSVVPEGPATENGSYTLDLSATYPENVPAGKVIDHWLINWGDGSDTEQFNGAVATAAHTFAAETISADISITAVDGLDNAYAAPALSITLAPEAPSGLSATYDEDGTGATLNWDSSSDITTGFEVQESVDGGDWTTVADVPVNDDSSDHSYSWEGDDISSDSSTLLRVISDGSDSSSSTTSSATAPDLEQPTIDQPEASDYSSSPDIVTDGLPTYFDSDDDVHLTVHNLQPHMDYRFSISLEWSGGTPAGYSRTLSGPHGTHVTQSWDGPLTFDSSADMGLSVDDNGSDSEAEFTITVHLPDQPGEDQPPVWWVDDYSLTLSGMGINLGSGVSSKDENSDTHAPDGPSEGAVVVGGEDYWAVHVEDNGIIAKEADLKVSGFDDSVIEVSSTDVTTDDYGWAFIPIQGKGVGSSPLIVHDSIGDVGMTMVGSYLPSISSTGGGSTGGGTEGVTYSAGHVPGFTLSIEYPVVDDLIVPYTTDGSTAGANRYAGLTTAAMTIPAGETSVFVPITIIDDNTMQPTEYVVVAIDEPSIDPQTQPWTRLQILDNDLPSVTINGNSDNAVIPLDTEGDPNKLVEVDLTAKTEMMPNRWTLEWSPELVIWPTRKVGAPGDDLAHIYGAQYDPYDGIYTYNGIGAPPTKVWAQAVGGSVAIDSTTIAFDVEISKPATQRAPAGDGGGSAAAHGTASGALIFWDGKDVTNLTPALGKKAGDVMIGQGISLEWVWVGPTADPSGDEFTLWNIPAHAVDGYDTTAGELIPLLDKELTSEDVHFYWIDGGQPGGSADKTVKLGGTYHGATLDVSTTFSVWTPNFTAKADHMPDGMEAHDDKNAKNVTIEPTDSKTGSQVTFSATVETPAIFSTKGSWHYTSVITSYMYDVIDADGSYHYSGHDSDAPNTAHRDQLDNTFVYPNALLNDVSLQGTAAAIAANTLTFYDMPNVSVGYGNTIVGTGTIKFFTSFQTYVMYNPGTDDAIDVALQVRSWSVGASVTSSNLDGPFVVVNNSVRNSLGKWRPTSMPPTWDDVFGNGSAEFSPPLKPRN